MPALLGSRCCMHVRLRTKARALKKVLLLCAAGGVAEEGLDEGGVSREFFQLLISEVRCLP